MKRNPWSMSFGKPGGMQFSVGQGHRPPYRRPVYAGVPGEPLSANQRTVTIVAVSAMFLGAAYLLSRKNEQATPVTFQPSGLATKV